MNLVLYNCLKILHSLCFTPDSITSCCSLPYKIMNQPNNAALFDNYHGEIILKEALFEKINNFHNIFQKLNQIKNCQKCKFFKQEIISSEQYINEITIANYTKCNADCIYCSNNKIDEEYSKYKYYNVFPILKNYKETDVIKKGCKIIISGGEYTLCDECDDIIEEFGVSDYAKINIYSNCIKYSPKILQAMDNKSTCLIHSLDCGSAETYKKVKNIDNFDIVISNLKKYSSTSNSKKQLILKYVVINNLNDSIIEFEKFIKIAEQLKINHILIEPDRNYKKITDAKTPKKLFKMIDNMKLIAINHGFTINEIE